MRVIPILLTATLLAGCSAAEQGGSQSTGGSTETATQEMAATDTAQRAPAAGKGGAEAVKATIPQLAYSYKLTYLLPGDKVAEVQDGHRALCEQMGPARCQLISLQRGTGEDIHSQATMQVRVASAEARSFSDAMGKSVTAAGGRNTESNIGTEEVSKQIVDTRARIKQRELLVARLTEILRTRRGSTAELIEAERSVTAAQEELEQARAWLAELSGRVAMANFEINYGSIAASANADSVSGQLGDATLGSATSFLIIARVLLTIGIYLAPWALLVFLGVWGVRALRRRGAAPAALPNEG
jgi:hypothetical protein